MSITASDRFASALRRQGFLPAPAFLRGASRRARASALGWSPQEFGGVFWRSRRVWRAGPWGTVRLALIGDTAIAYRPARDGCRIVLLGFLRPSSRLWPAGLPGSPLREDDDQPPRG